MRTLVVATEYPWPANSGSRLRLGNTLCALRALGAVELFSIVSDGRTDFDPAPAALGLERVARIAVDDRPPGPGDYLRGLGAPGTPFELPRRARPVAQRALDGFRAGPYDLVWYFQVRAWVLAGRRGPAATVVDIDDLEDEKILARAALPHPGGSGGGLRRLGSRLWTHEDVRRWRRLHRRIAGQVAATVVCSELDAARARLPGVRVLRNGYDAPAHPVGRIAVSSPPVVTFQGTLRYPPNADGARFLVEEVGPVLRRLVPGVQIRLVGLSPPALSALHDPPAVTVTGRVPDITDELARADVVVIPLRYGSGTRIKILEAFAHRIPVVSTTVGAEGLEVRGEHHLLVADDPDAIARACARLLHDTALRRAVVEEAHALFVDRYQSSRVQEEVRALADEVARR